MKKLVLSIAAVSLMNAAIAITPVQEAEFALQQGHFARAEALLQGVIAANPGNARAHYRYAELLARDGNVPAAADEAKAALRIDPKITFADPANFRLFEAGLRERQVRLASAADLGARRR